MDTSKMVEAIALTLATMAMGIFFTGAVVGMLIGKYWL